MGKKEVLKTRNSGKLTESAYFSKIRSGLRRTFQWWTPMIEALNAVSRPYNGENKRLKKEYKCSRCNNYFPRKQVEVHHKIPCGSLKSYEDIVPFIQRLTVEGAENYEILCKICHQKETNIEKELKKLKNDKK